MTTPVEELRSAAALLREWANMAQAVVPSPWRVVITDTESETGVASCDDHKGEPFHACDGCAVAETYSESMAAYVAALSPLVGLALADWLDGRAAYAEGRTAATVAQWELLADIADAAVEHAEPHALKLARLILGGDS